MAYPTFQSVGAFNSANGASVVLDKPTGVAAGDLLIAVLGSKNVGYNTLSGWTAGPTRADGAGNLSVFTRVADAADVAASTYTWAPSSSERCGGFIARYTGQATSSPIEASAGSGLTTATNPTTGPTVTTLGAERLVLHCAFYGLNAAMSAPSGTTQRAAGNSVPLNGCVVLADEQKATAGTTTARSWVPPGSGTISLIVLSLAPPGGGGAAGPVLFHGHYQNMGWR